MVYQNINTEEDLLEFLNTFDYGIKTKEDVYLYDDANNHLDKWKTKDVNNLIKDRVGICYDLVEIERDWFSKHHYKFMTLLLIFLLDYQNPYPTHTLLIYEKNNKWYHFESADFFNRGIHEYNSFDELIENVKKKQIVSANLEQSEIKDTLGVFIYDKPNLNESFTEFLDNIIDKGKRIC